jgi:dolichyl-phosphate beta-glucosyltransferase
MAAAPYLAVVVPAFNEDARIGETLAELHGWLGRQPWAWEIRVVDDGSTDRTAATVEQATPAGAPIVLQREPHGGKGAAVKAGLLASRAAYRLICDADLSMPVSELPRFLAAAETADVVIGSREGQGARRIGEPVIRHLAGRAFNHAVQWLMMRGIEDTQCGFKLFSAAAVDAIFPLVQTRGWAFDIEVLYVARQQGLTIREVPIEWHYRRQSRLHLLRDGVGMLADLLAIRARAARGAYRPRGSQRPPQGA